MYYITKYIIPVADKDYIWFSEQNKQVYFGYEKNTTDMSDCIILHQYGQYGDYIYTTFGSDIYKANTNDCTVKLLFSDVYDVHYLDKCIIMTTKKNNRLDEIIKLIPLEDATETIGQHLKPNTLRE